MKLIAYVLVAWCIGIVVGAGLFITILVLSDFMGGIERVYVVVVGVIWALSALGTQVVTGLRPWIAFVVFTAGAAIAVYFVTTIPGIGHGNEGLG